MGPGDKFDHVVRRKLRSLDDASQEEDTPQSSKRPRISNSTAQQSTSTQASGSSFFFTLGEARVAPRNATASVVASNLQVKHSRLTNDLTALNLGISKQGATGRAAQAFTIRPTSQPELETAGIDLRSAKKDDFLLRLAQGILEAASQRAQGDVSLKLLLSSTAKPGKVSVEDVARAALQSGTSSAASNEQGSDSTFHCRVRWYPSNARTYGAELAFEVRTTRKLFDSDSSERFVLLQSEVPDANVLDQLPEPKAKLLFGRQSLEGDAAAAKPNATQRKWLTFAIQHLHTAELTTSIGRQPSSPPWALPPLEFFDSSFSQCAIVILFLPDDSQGKRKHCQVMWTDREQSRAAVQRLRDMLSSTRHLGRPLLATEISDVWVRWQNDFLDDSVGADPQRAGMSAAVYRAASERPCGDVCSGSWSRISVDCSIDDPYEDDTHEFFHLCAFAASSKRAPDCLGFRVECCLMDVIVCIPCAVWLLTCSAWRITFAGQALLMRIDDNNAKLARRWLRAIEGLSTASSTEAQRAQLELLPSSLPDHLRLTKEMLPSIEESQSLDLTRLPRTRVPEATPEQRALIQVLLPNPFGGPLVKSARESGIVEEYTSVWSYLQGQLSASLVVTTTHMDLFPASTEKVIKAYSNIPSRFSVAQRFHCWREQRSLMAASIDLKQQIQFEDGVQTWPTHSACGGAHLHWTNFETNLFKGGGSASIVLPFYSSIHIRGTSSNAVPEAVKLAAIDDVQAYANRLQEYHSASWRASRNVGGLAFPARTDAMVEESALNKLSDLPESGEFSEDLKLIVQLLADQAPDLEAAMSLPPDGSLYKTDTEKVNEWYSQDRERCLSMLRELYDKCSVASRAAFGTQLAAVAGSTLEAFWTCGLGSNELQAVKLLSGAVSRAQWECDPEEDGPGDEPEDDLEPEANPELPDDELDGLPIKCGPIKRSTTPTPPAEDADELPFGKWSVATALLQWIHALVRADGRLRDGLTGWRIRIRTRADDLNGLTIFAHINHARRFKLSSLSNSNSRPELWLSNKYMSSVPFSSKFVMMSSHRPLSLRWLRRLAKLHTDANRPLHNLNYLLDTYSDDALGELDPTEFRDYFNNERLGVKRDML